MKEGKTVKSKSGVIVSILLCIFAMASLPIFSGSSASADNVTAPTAAPVNIAAPPPPSYRQKTSVFAIYPHERHAIVFFGDSITEHAQWSAIFPGKHIYNFGIEGDNTHGMLLRMNEVTNLKPDKVFIMAGINDLFQGQSVNNIVANYTAMVRYIKKHSPHTKIYLESTLPTNQKLSGDKVDPNTIVQLNQDIRNIARTQHATFINLYPLFAVNHVFNPKLTDDGVHPLGQGYMIWKRAIQKYV